VPAASAGFDIAVVERRRRCFLLPVPAVRTRRRDFSVPSFFPSARSTFARPHGVCDTLRRRLSGLREIPRPEYAHQPNTLRRCPKNSMTAVPRQVQKERKQKDT
ncbi:unnamed protein product, partial [Ixodes pacificus]